MVKKVLITGGTGMVGSRLCSLLQTQGCQVSVLSRKHRHSRNGVEFYRWDLNEGYIEDDALIGVDVIVHLAGVNIGSGRWTGRRKGEILKSRTASTVLLRQEVANRGVSIKSFISASAIGYYGTTTSEHIYSEDAPAGNDFLAKVCQQWEAQVLEFEKLGTSVTILRTAVVLARQGGALRKMLLPAKLGLNAPLGSGQQYMPWIHLDDLSRMYSFFVQNSTLSGIYNAVASEHIKNKEFAEKLSNVLNKPLFVTNVPAFVLRLVFGEMATILLNGSRVGNERVLSTGFKFKYETVEEALNDILLNETRL